MSTPASVEAGKADVKRAALEEYVTLVVTDEEGRRLTRTMRRSDQLQVLMDYYYSMVPTVKHGDGIFIYESACINGYGTSTPACFVMKDGDEIRYIPEIEVVTPVVRDFAGRSFTRTMRTTDQLQLLMDFYRAMVPAAGVAPEVFLYCGECVTGDQTPAGIGMKEWDMVYAVPTVRGEVGQEKQSDDYITLQMRDRKGRKAYRTMRRTEKLEVLIDLFCATVVAAEGDLRQFRFNRRYVHLYMTPALLEMKDGDKVDYYDEFYGFGKILDD